jgi:hypothetical protein
MYKINAACSPRINTPSDQVAQPVRSLERRRPPWIRGEKSADLIQLPKYEFDCCEIVLKLAFRA